MNENEDISSEIGVLAEQAEQLLIPTKSKQAYCKEYEKLSSSMANKSISESARRLDDAHSCAQNVGDLFTPTLQIQRSRFQEYCERLIFSEPILFGRKAEELLWRKAYYDVISAAKKLKKKDYTSEDLCNIQTHINAGVGHYHHFISRLQYQFNLDIRNFVDFSIFKNNLKKLNSALQKPESLDWANQSVHRCLIYLGDLNRYKLELYPNWDPVLAIRYYVRAVHFKPEYGIPHNQMGTLASSQNRTLDAVYHYMCCLACKHAFEGTENNLLRLFEKNSRVLDEYSHENRNADCIVQLEPVDHIKRLISRFLFLVETWFFNKKVSDIYILCHQTSMDLQECLSYSKPVLSESGDSPTDVESVETDSISSPAYVTEDMIFKIIVICLLCITKLQKSQSHQTSTIVAFTLAVYSQLLQIVTDHIYDNLLNVMLPNSESEIVYNHTNGIVKHESRKSKKTKKQKAKIRRRRKQKCSSEEDSELSDVDDDIGSSSDQSVDASEDERGNSSSDNESGDDNLIKEKSSLVDKTETNPKSNDKVDVEKSENNSLGSSKSFTELAEKTRKIDPIVMLETITEEKLLDSIKIISDWLILDVEIVKSCGKNTRSLLKQIVQLLNFLNIDLSSFSLNNLKHEIKQIKQDQGKIALVEDVALKGIEIVSNAHNNFDWNYFHSKTLSPNEETAIRIVKLVEFGHCLAKIEETGISFNSKKQLFVIQTIDVNEDNGFELVIGESGTPNVKNESTSLSGVKETANNESRGQLTKMKHMGQLWLAAEVRALENRVKGRTSLSPYLVLDADCLTQFSPIVKHLVNSKKFIVVVPSAVVSALDDLKREQSEARDAIRWLELQLHHGNRFCRAQRPQERASLPLIKYPKKKDKEMFAYIQIIECCHYLALQQKDATNLVTLLLGNENTLSNCENREISYTGLARSAGINLEFVTNFYDKWRKNFKGKK